MNNTIAPFSFPEVEFNAYDIIRKNKKNRELEIQLSRKGINVKRIFKLRKYL